MCLVLLLSTNASTAFAQSSDYQDRLARIRDLTRNSELIVAWSEDDGAGGNVVSQRIYDLNLVESDISQRLEPQSIQSDFDISGQRRIAITTGNFTGSEFEHIVSAWSGPDGSVTVVVPEIDPEGLGWTDVQRLTAEGLLATSQGAKIRLAAGDFVGDGITDEFVLGFHGDDDKIRLQVYGFSEDGLDPHVLGSVADEEIAQGLEAWDLVAGDFDGDGDEDIALLFIRPDASNDWSITAKIYSVEQDGSVTAGPIAEVFPKPDFQFSSIDVSGTAGDFDNDASMELAVAFTFAQDDPEPDTYMYLLDVDPGVEFHFFQRHDACLARCPERE